MNTLNKLKYFIVLLFIMPAIGCFKDLDTVPIDEDITTPNVVYEDPNAYLAVLAKCYSGLAVTGQQGPAGQGDIDGIDEGFSSYLRILWKMQELPTEEAVIGWNDQTIKDFHEMDWTAADGFIAAMYYRIFYQISICNEFLRQTTDEVLAERGVTEDLKREIVGYRAEARFLRALSYWHGLDFFRNIPFVTEEDPIGSFFPRQANAKEIFDFIESELLAIESDIAPARSNDYGRADQGAVWTLLAKLYLNAEVYIGENRYTDCATYSEKVLNAGYMLDEDYQNLFLADNHTADGIIFPINFDGIKTRTWGGTTFIIRASIGGQLNPAEFGVTSGWGGTRCTKELIQKFGEIGGNILEFNEGRTATYPKIYVPGDYQGNDASNTATSLSSINSDKIYEGYKYFPEDNMTFLFTRIPSLALSLGDNDGDGTLEANGERIAAGEAGLYYFQVNLNDNTYTLERQKWSVEGSALVDGAAEFAWDEETQTLKVNVEVIPGTLRFVSDGVDGFVLGDSDLDGILTYGDEGLELNETGPVEIFLDLDKPDYTYQIGSLSFDRRGLFSSQGQNLEINDIATYTDGYAVSKFKNVTSTGAAGSNEEHVDTDFPLFRLADVYLMASEALLRSNGDKNKATDYFNAVRKRAFKGSGGNIAPEELTLSLLIDERARELYWECTRRTDLIRFGLFTSDTYLWEWKGGVKEGRGVEAFRVVYPIPSADVNANPNLLQNEGY